MAHRCSENGGPTVHGVLNNHGDKLLHQHVLNQCATVATIIICGMHSFVHVFVLLGTLCVFGLSISE